MRSFCAASKIASMSVLVRGALTVFIECLLFGALAPYDAPRECGRRRAHLQRHRIRGIQRRAAPKPGRRVQTTALRFLEAFAFALASWAGDSIAPRLQSKPVVGHTLVRPRFAALMARGRRLHESPNIC